MVDLKPCKDYFEQVRRHFGFISRIDDSNDRKVSRVVKLNGTASIVDKKLENQLETDSLIGYPNVEISRECILVPLPSVAGDQPFINGYKRIENQMAKLSRIYKKFHVSPDDFVPNLCFSWDTDENHTVLKAGLDVMSHSDVLVVIGYSFPAFNLANDIKLLKAFADGGGNKVYIQLPKGSAQEAEGRVKQIFSSMGHAVEIQVIENCGQFYIPSEYFESKPPIIGSYVAFSSRNGGIDMI
jgi:hypothetical protein